MVEAGRFAPLPYWFKAECRSFAASAQPQEESDDASELSIGSGGASGHTRPKPPPPTPFMDETADIKEGPIALYRKGRLESLYRPDPGQENTVAMLQDLYEDLRAAHPKKQRRPSGLTVVDSVGSPDTQAKDGSGSWWSSFMGSSGQSDSSSGGGGAGSAPRGLYMHGGVGVGKTMLMDLLASSAPSEFKLRRTHFHDFMLDVHSRLQKHRTASDALITVADELASELRVLCLDEFFVTDVADAVILNRLFGRLFDKVLLVTTSPHTSIFSVDSCYAMVSSGPQGLQGTSQGGGCCCLRAFITCKCAWKYSEPYRSYDHIPSRRLPRNSKSRHLFDQFCSVGNVCRSNIPCAPPLWHFP